MGFVVTGEAAMVHEPAERPLDDPAPWYDLEPFLARLALGDLNVDAEASAMVDDLGAVAGIGPRPW